MSQRIVENSSQEYLAPDYSKLHPTEDDDIIEEIDEDEAAIERILDEQEKLNNGLIEEMSEFPFQNWSGSGNNNKESDSKAPWEKTEEKPNNSFSLFGSGSSSLFNNQKQEQKTQTTVNGGPSGKEAVVCELLDVLYESFESNGKPHKLPRGIFDIRPKFEVWDKILSFAPRRLYVIIPASEEIPGFGDRKYTKVAMEYISYCLSVYFRIPKDNVFLVKKSEGMTKRSVLNFVCGEWKAYQGGIKTLIYVGIHSGRWGLSSEDKDIARELNLDYIDMFKLVSGNYEFE